MWVRLAALRQKPALRQGLAVLLDQGFLSIANFTTGILVARANSKEAYGLYVLCWSLLLMLQGLQRALVNVPFTLYAPRLDAPDRAVYQGSGLMHTLLLCAALAAGFAIARNANMHYAVLDLAVPLVLFISALFVRDYLRTALLARLNIKGSVAVSLAASAVQLLFVIGLFKVQRLTPATALVAGALASLLAAIYMTATYRSEIRVVARRLTADFLRGWKISRWIIWECFVYIGAYQSIPWIILHYHGAQDVAIFGATLAVAGLIAPFLRGASGYIQPRMAHAYKGGCTQELRRLLRLALLAVGIPFMAWLGFGLIFGERLVTLLYTSTYGGYPLLLAFLLLQVVLEGASTPLSQALQTLEKVKFVTFGLLIGSATTLSLGPYLIAQYGLNGAGAIAVITASLIAVWKWLILRRVLHALP